MSARVLVTGATGFVGRTLVPLLQEQGCDVVPVSRDDLSAAPGAVVAALEGFRADVMVHLATRFVAEHAVDEIPALVEANVTAGTLVAEAAARSGSRLVTIGTAWQHVEGRDYDPVSLYAATKQALDAVTDYYVAVRGLERRIVTLFDTYGPGDPRPKLVPALLQAVRTGRPLPMSDGHQLIDLTYVDDVAAGIAQVALADEAPDASVLRTWSPLSIRALVAEVEAVLGRRVPVEWGARPSRPREMRSDWVFGEGPAGWEPRVPLADGIARTWRAGEQAT